MLGWRKLLVVLAIDGAFLFLSGVLAESSHHSGTASNVLWVDFLIGVMLLIVLAMVNVVRSALLALRR
jgi:prepilin-type processing-associated H-X9-DG protein